MNNPFQNDALAVKASSTKPVGTILRAVRRIISISAVISARGNGGFLAWFQEEKEARILRREITSLKDHSELRSQKNSRTLLGE